MLDSELVEGNRGVPLSAVADHGVEDDEQLSHARDHGDLGWFSLGGETLIEGADDGVLFQNSA